MRINKSAIHGSGYRRPRPEGCWDFCGKDCELESLGLCRTYIPEFEASPPNDGVDKIDSLRFGLRSYEREITEWHKERRKNKNTPDWRESLSPKDPFADILIVMDREEWIKGNKGVVLWDGWRYENLLMQCPEVITAIIATQAEGYTDNAFRQLRKELKNLFLRELYQDCDEPDKAFDVFSDATQIIAEWCLEKYCEDPVYWGEIAAQYGNMPDYIKALKAPKKKKYRFRKLEDLKKDGRRVRKRTKPL